MVVVQKLDVRFAAQAAKLIDDVDGVCETRAARASGLIQVGHGDVFAADGQMVRDFAKHIRLDLREGQVVGDANQPQIIQHTAHFLRAVPIKAREFHAVIAHFLERF